MGSGVVLSFTEVEKTHEQWACGAENAVFECEV